ncbi:hypothetical protein [uncultured Tolumonas sp.]|uniref:hypothetical protein n=1 Tax=uncultured Tolumonas sp. TaxID=263765 RepID=UPI002A0A1A04|nr:hypothetical protein [uncultured Tolumonas sp.]
MHAGNTENISNTIPIDHAAVLDAVDNTLALILQNMDGSQPLLIERAGTDISLSDIDVLYVNASIPDPLDLLSRAGSHFVNKFDLIGKIPRTGQYFESN